MALFNVVQEQPAAAGGAGETFIQRQRRLAGQRRAELAGQPQGTGAQTSFPDQRPQTQSATQTQQTQSAQPTVATTPVTGNGKIPEPQQAAPAPQPAPAPVPKPTPPPGIPANFVQLRTGEWVPPERTDLINKVGLAPGFAPAQSATAITQEGQKTSSGAVAQSEGPLNALALGNDPFKTYTASQFNVPIPELGRLPQSYRGTEFTQFEAPNQRETEALQVDLLNRILSAPETLSPEVLAQLKEKNKEAALLMQQQNLQQAAQNAAARGISGGQLTGLQQAILGDAMNRIITGNRDLDIAAMERNRADQLAALSAAEGVLSGQMGRASEAFRNILTGQTAQAEDDRAVAQDAIARAIAGHEAALASAGLNLQQQGMNADERFRQFQTERDAQDAEIDRILAQFGMNQAAIDSRRADRGLALQEELGRGGLALDTQRLAEQQRQFDAGHGLNILQFLEGRRQHNNNLGFNYAQLGQQGQQALINQILAMLG